MNKFRHFSSSVSRYQKKSFDQLINSRRNEGRRSVLISTGDKMENEMNTLHQIRYQCKVKNLDVKSLSIFHERSTILLEFFNENQLTIFMNNSTFFNNSLRLPIRTRQLYLAERNDLYFGDKKTKFNFPIHHYHNSSNNDDFRKVHLNEKNLKEDCEKDMMDEGNIRLRFFLSSLIEDVFRHILPQNIALPFGSSMNGFGVSSSDLDIFYSFEEFRNEPTKLSRGKYSSLKILSKRSSLNDRYKAQLYLNLMGECIKLFLPECTDVGIILPARVPIVRFFHRLTQINCDISMNSVHSSYFMTKYLWLMNESNDQLKYLVSFLRKLGKEMKITNSISHRAGEWFSNFQLTFLVIFFMKSNQLLPSMEMLNEKIKKNEKNLIIDRINCTLPNETKKIDEKKWKTRDLIVEFFKFYAIFQFDKFQISMRNSQLIERIITDENENIFLDNPLDPGKNMGRNISKKELDQFQMICERIVRIFEGKNEVTIDELSSSYQIDRDEFENEDEVEEMPKDLMLRDRLKFSSCYKRSRSGLYSPPLPIYESIENENIFTTDTKK
ncbi:hypothetical protein SNEBB_002883 [Seison nebaliae]|nr:hypothetical protein SNEBB_002883 [Seison nebaliae]